MTSLGLVILAIAAGCSSGEKTASPPEPLSSAELGWVRAEASWAIDIYDDELGPDGGGALAATIATRHWCCCLWLWLICNYRLCG